jgi:hypothetical protein
LAANRRSAGERLLVPYSARAGDSASRDESFMNSEDRFQIGNRTMNQQKTGSLRSLFFVLISLCFAREKNT